ncbi:hypothetical protein L4D00_23515 [Photobacterium swingsii]|uniref:hypothetical protein n=1 Tax=Photobacterium swingsii TaxID=680026 RepID=UPI003D12A740
MLAYKSLKKFTLTIYSSAIILIFISYINGLGCRNTTRHLITEYEIYSTCNSGVATVRLTGKNKPSDILFEMKGYFFTLFNHQIVYIADWNQTDVKKTLPSPFYITFSNNLFLHSSVNRFNSKWIGVHMDVPINLSYIAEIEGYLSLQDRFNLN